MGLRSPYKAHLVKHVSAKGREKEKTKTESGAGECSEWYMCHSSSSSSPPPPSPSNLLLIDASCYCAPSWRYVRLWRTLQSDARLSSLPRRHLPPSASIQILSPPRSLFPIRRGRCRKLACTQTSTWYEARIIGITSRSMFSGGKIDCETLEKKKFPPLVIKNITL